ncbi:hypothetical protein C5167_019901 [Papaver somniferum]|uniref:Uncharacterized protein n=1 Tax=Papaver somniferum TaxID=3469 RepID=A0A4Y7IVP6_PAPSO|nr:hypothetical protein C5167_019901 [Papaver somniferum]
MAKDKDQSSIPSPKNKCASKGKKGALKAKDFQPSPLTNQTPCLNTPSTDVVFALNDGCPNTELLSRIFSSALPVVNDPALAQICDAMMKLCVDPSLDPDSLRDVASVMSPELHSAFEILNSRRSEVLIRYQRERIRNLEGEVSRAQREVASRDATVVNLRKRNSQLLEVFNLSNKAFDFSIEDSILLEHFNSMPDR